MPEASLELWWTFFLGTAILLFMIIGLLSIVILSRRQKLKDQSERVRILEESEKKIRALLDQSEMLRRNLAEFSREILRVQEEERSFISRELHDEVGQLLATISVNLGVVQKELFNFTPSAQQRIKETQSLVQETFTRLHGVLSELRTVAVGQLGLIGATRNFTEEFSYRSGIEVELRAVEEIEILAFEQKLALYRVIQEGLTNVLRHAHANRVTIDISRINSNFHMKVKDNGQGFDISILNNPSIGSEVPFGLLGIMERVKLASGSCLITSERGEGTSIDIDIPVPSGNRSENEQSIN